MMPNVAIALRVKCNFPGMPLAALPLCPCFYAGAIPSVKDYVASLIFGGKLLGRTGDSSSEGGVVGVDRRSRRNSITNSASSADATQYPLGTPGRSPFLCCHPRLACGRPNHRWISLVFAHEFRDEDRRMCSRATALGQFRPLHRRTGRCSARAREPAGARRRKAPEPPEWTAPVAAPRTLARWAAP